MIDIRAMTDADVVLGEHLCRLAGWNQTAADWRRLLARQPDGLFVAEIDGCRCGTASAVAHGRRVGWIGMVLVDPAFRRRGVGTALLERCIAHLRLRVETIKLDATDAGRAMYLKLGFADEQPICRYAGRRPANARAATDVAPIAGGDWPAIGAMDAEAFGADRLGLLTSLAADGPAVVAAGVDGGEARGYGLARAGHEAWQIGPLVAAEPAAARAVAETLLAELPQDASVLWDLLPDNADAAMLAESLGLSPARRLTRMYLGDRPHAGCVGNVYAAAGFELG